MAGGPRGSSRPSGASSTSTPTPGQFLLTGSVRAELTNEMWAGTGRVIRLTMQRLTERELAGHLDPAQPAFLTSLTTTGIADLRLPEPVPDLEAYVPHGDAQRLSYRKRTEQSTGQWLTSNLDELVTRDAALADQRKDPAKLRRYLLHDAGLPTDATLYAAASINAKTAAGHDQLLQNLQVLDKVPAWGANRLTSLV